MIILVPFGGPWIPFWDNFAIEWVTDALKATLGRSQAGFSMISHGLWVPSGRLVCIAYLDECEGGKMEHLGRSEHHFGSLGAATGSKAAFWEPKSIFLNKV